MRRNLVQPAAVLLLALHGLIAVAGNAGLHVVFGCTHGHDADFCSEAHKASCGCECGDCCGSEHPVRPALRAAPCLNDSHGCPICHWWYTNGQQIVASGNAVHFNLQPLIGVVGDFGVLLQGFDLRECFPRGPPAALAA